MKYFYYLISFSILLCTIVTFACDETDVSNPGADGDIDSDSDSDSDTGSNDESLTEAYFIIDSITVGKNNLDDACDLNENGKPSNAVARLLNAVPPSMLEEDPNETIKQKIESGESLMVVGMYDVDSFENDDNVLLKAFKGIIDLDAGVPDDLFSGHGSIDVETPAQSTIENGSIVDGNFSTPESTFMAAMPLGEDVFDVELKKAYLFSSTATDPDKDMLNGVIDYGKICGAIDAQEFSQMVKQSEDVPATLKAFVGPLINQYADLDCKETGKKNCLSLGMLFTAKSVSRSN